MQNEPMKARHEANPPNSEENSTGAVREAALKRKSVRQ